MDSWKDVGKNGKSKKREEKNEGKQNEGTLDKMIQRERDETVNKKKRKEKENKHK